MFPHTPAAQSAAAKWLRAFTWNGILFTMVWQNVFLFQWAVFRQCDFEPSLFIKGYDGVLLMHKNASKYRGFHQRQLHKLLQSNSCGDSIERNFVLYGLAKYLSILTSRFCHVALKKSYPVGCVGVVISRKYASLHRCFHTRQLRQLLRPNGRGVSSEREFCSLWSGNYLLF